MIYYKAVCYTHDWESDLYKDPNDAANKLEEHENSIPGEHNSDILEVYIPNEYMHIKSYKV